MQKILSLLRQCVEDYHMIAPNDRIAVGVSGGKDSLLLLSALCALQKFYPIPFEVEAITVDMGYPDADFSAIRDFCDRLGVRYTVVHTQIKEIIFDVRKEENPCSLCAKMRHGALHDAAKELSCNKVALGHHQDDAIETFLMSLYFEGRIHCFSPVTYLERKDITLIRPLLYLPERYVWGYAKRENLPVTKNPCPVDGHTKREYIKQHIKGLEQENPGIKKRLFTALRNSLPDWQVH